MRSPTAADVRAVVDTGTGLRTALQPIVDLRVAEIAGYEALTRFGGPSAPPDEWFAVAHASGQGPELEALALRSAFARRAVVPDGVFLAVNVSPHLLESAPVQEAFDDAAPLDDVVVELTEHVDPGEREPLLRALLGLRARGARIALDDMGTGYSGLRELATLQPDVVKLDRSFTDHCDSDTVKAAVVESLCSIADRLQATLVAEGVERLEELDWLQRAGVPLGQGWLLGPARRPPAAAVAGNGSPAAFSRGARHPGQPGDRGGHHALGSRCGPRRNLLSRRGMDPASRRCHGPGARRTWTRGTARRAWCSGEANGPAGDELPITLRTSLDTPLTHLARQISSRPAARRFDPVVCTGTDGTYLGVIDVEQLLRVLADLVDGLGRAHVPTT